MSNRYLVIFVILGLLSQQAVANGMSLSMLEHAESMTVQNQQQEGHMAHMDMLNMMDMASSKDAPEGHSSEMNCCDMDCGCETACSYSMIPVLSLRIGLHLQTPVPEGLSSHLPVRRLSSLFRPPISA